jgi:phage antirepressor YoqD-like protein
MSSVEIATLTGKEHKNVLVDIRKMLFELYNEDGIAEFSAVYKDQQLITRPCFNLPKRETLILVSGYSIVMRAKIIDRWQELENQLKPKLPMTMLEVFQAALDAEKARLVAEEKLSLSQEKLALAAPKVQAFDNITASNYEHNLRDSAKLLGIKPGKMSFWLSTLKWITQGNGKHWFPYQKVIDSGLMVVRENEIEMEDGSTKIRPQAMVTQKGITTLALRIVNGECPVAENAKAATNLL